MTRPTRLVLLSSEQLMPSIESVMLLLANPDVALVRICLEEDAVNTWHWGSLDKFHRHNIS